MGTWRTLHLRRILHAASAISVHGSVTPGEPRTRTLQSVAECSADSATAGVITTELYATKYNVKIAFRRQDIKWPFYIRCVFGTITKF